MAPVPTGPSILRRSPASGLDLCGNGRECVSSQETLSAAQQNGRVGSRIAMTHCLPPSTSHFKCLACSPHGEPSGRCYRPAEAGRVVSLSSYNSVFNIEREGIP